MIAGITKKIIFTSVLFINFIHSSKSTDFNKIIKDKNNQDTNFNLSIKSNFKHSTDFLNKKKIQKRF